MTLCSIICAKIVIKVANSPSFDQPPSEGACLISNYVKDPTNATEGIQNAVNDCYRKGTVEFDVPSTNYSTGAILIRGDGIKIILSSTVVLQAATDRDSYPGPQSDWYLLHFDNCTNCELIGGGTIDGQGRNYVTSVLSDRKDVFNFKDASCFNVYECRPRMIGIKNSNNVSITGNIHIIDPIYWTVHVIGSQKVTLQGLNIAGDWQIFNTDGIDIDSSTDVVVKDCDIDTADDAICVKTTLRSKPVERAVVDRCRLRSRASAVKLGSESVSDFRDLEFTNLNIHDSHRGLAIQLRDGGSISNVAFKDITVDLKNEEFAWWGASEIVYITAGPRFQGRKVGNVHNVSIYNIKATSENGIFISGMDDTSDTLERVHNISLINVDIILRNQTQYSGGYQDYRPGPEDVKRANGGTFALFVQAASAVSLRNLRVRYSKPFRADWKERMLIGNVEQFTLTDVSIDPLYSPMAGDGSAGGVINDKEQMMT